MSSDTLKIKKVIYGAKGLAEKENKKIFVKNTFTDDEVKYEILKSHKNFEEAKATRFVKKSPARRSSPCLYSSQCGGCQWIDIKESHQLNTKQEFIKESFKRIGSLKKDLSITITKSPKILNYRNRILLRGTIENGNIGTGFFKYESHEQIHIKECKIAHPAHNKLIFFLSESSLKESKKKKFRLEAQIVPEAYNKKEPCLLITLFPGEKNQNLKSLFLLLKGYKDTAHISYSYEKIHPKPVLFETQDNISYLTVPRIFQQVNSEANQKLRSRVKELALKIKANSILDLYCGAGNLSLQLANKERKILGVELSKESIRTAKENVKRNKLVNICYRAENAPKFLKKLNEIGKSFDLVILDPPRKGAKEDISSLLLLNPKYILYISCDPSTAARDYKTLSKNYEIISLEGFDFFPQTYHVETLIFLKKKP